MNNNKFNWFAALVLIIITVGCSAPRVTAIKEVRPLPEVYTAAETPDSISVARLGFRDFFSDSLLTGLIQQVLNNNLDNKIAAERIKIARAYMDARQSALLPAVTADLRLAGTHYGKHTMEGVGNFDTNLSPNIDKSQQIPTTVTPDYWLGLNASWEIDLWGKLKSMKVAAMERFLATQQGKDLLTAALVSHTATLYYELVMLDKKVSILNQNIQLQEKALEVIKIHKDVGKATELAVVQFDAQLSNTKASLYAAKQHIVATENKLLELTGRYEGTINRSDTIDIRAIQYLAQHGNPRQLMQYRPDIRMAYHELSASHADARAARAAFFPSVRIGGYAGLNSFNLKKFVDPTSIAYQLLGGITAPVFQKRQLKAAFKVASSEQEIAFLNYQKNVNAAFQEVRTLLSYIGNNEEVLREKRNEVQTLDRGLLVSQELYLSAYATYLEIIAAQKSKIAAEMDLLQTEQNQVKVLIQLYKALGGGVVRGS